MGLWSRFKTWLLSLFWNQEMELAILGLQNAGKTTLVNSLSTSEFDEDTIPTIGFNFREMRKGRVQLKLWDLGGQERFRESWEKYCRGVNCIVFVVDSADYGNLEIARTEMHNLLAWPSLSGIPLLVLGNKNDLDSALTEEELIAAMNLREISGRPVACYSISAKNQVNLDITMKYLTDLPKKA